MKEIVDAIESLERSLPEPFDGEIRLSVDDYNLISSIYDQLESIANSLKIIANK
jgi:uncharacterized protein Yka (UPF0111/DUF47 family)